jgi:hypothetical protein
MIRIAPLEAVPLLQGFTIDNRFYQDEWRSPPQPLNLSRQDARICSTLLSARRPAVGERPLVAFRHPKAAIPLSANSGPSLASGNVSPGEGFRMPSGVGKPPMHEPAGLR